MRRLVLTLALCAQASVAMAQEMYKDVEYIAGKSGLDHKVKGTLILSATGVTLMDDAGTAIFRIPVSTITNVNNETDVRDASVGKKLLLGSFAGSRKQEFVNITSETDSAAEAIVLKAKQGTSVGIVAKIKFAMKQLAASGAEPETKAAPADTVSPAASK